MKKQNYFILLLSVLSYCLFITADIVTGNRILAGAISVSFILLRVIVQLITFKRFDKFFISDIILIVGGSIASLSLENTPYNMIRPAIIPVVWIIILSFIALSSKVIIFAAKKYASLFVLSEDDIRNGQLNSLLLVPFIVIYILLLVYLSLGIELIIWKIVAASSIYPLIILPLVLSVWFQRLRNKAFIKKYKDSEWFPVVDHEGKIIGKSPREVCHSGSMILHPVVHIHILNTDRKLLLQKRSINKDIQPGKWDTSVGGHISSGEELMNAVKREAKEELGITINEKYLIPIKKYIYESEIERELVFSFIYITNDSIKTDPVEIDDARFFTENETNDIVLRDLTTPNFIEEFKLLKSSELKVFDNIV